MNAMEHRWRLLTSPLRMLPDFVIPGEAKCGTSSLYHYLTQHPRIRRADVKEPNNFLDYGGSPLLCRMHYPLVWNRLAGALTGEASAEYFSKPHVAPDILRVRPDIRVILLLRNPVTRAFSDHQMFFKDGRERVPFDEVVKRSLAWLSDPAMEPLLDAASRPNHNPIRYVRRGVYLPTLRRWQAAVPAERLLILKSEDLFDQPQAVTDQVFAFLGLPPHSLRDVAPRKKGAYVAPAHPDALRALARFYRPHNEALYRHLGRDFGWEAEVEALLGGSA